MTAPGHADPLALRVADALGRLPGGTAAWGTTGVLAAAPVASPVHRAVSSDCIRVERAGAPAAFVKIHHPDTAADIVSWAADASRKAAALGVGPDVVGEAEGVLALACLDPPWRTATVGDLQEADTLGRVLDAKRRLHEDTPLGRRFCPFDRIAALAAEAAAVGAPLPRDAQPLLAAVDLVREAVAAAGFDLRFCHNDGTASNVMLDGSALRLVDFDTAGDNDPWFDIAATINEACDFDDERRAAVERYAGRCDERVMNRCRLYGAVDDAMWGLWGVTRAVTTRRSGIEFFKYGQWRLLHARTAVGARGFETWLRRL